MWAYQQPEARTFQRIEIPESELDPGQVAVQFVVGGICRSDIPAFFGQRDIDSFATGDPGALANSLVGCASRH